MGQRDPGGDVHTVIPCRQKYDGRSQDSGITVRHQVTTQELSKQIIIILFHPYTTPDMFKFRVLGLSELGYDAPREAFEAQHLEQLPA